jgi:hypothetical protein
MFLGGFAETKLLYENYHLYSRHVPKPQKLG